MENNLDIEVVRMNLGMNIQPQKEGSNQRPKMF